MDSDRHPDAAQSMSPETGSRNSHKLDVKPLGADEAWAVHMRAAPLLQLGRGRVALPLGQRAYRGAWAGVAVAWAVSAADAEGRKRSTVGVLRWMG